MTGAWFVCLLKDVVQYFLNYTDPDNNVVWNELAVTAGLATNLSKRESIEIQVKQMA